MLKGICDMRLDIRKVLCAPGPRTKYFELFFCCLINHNTDKFIFTQHKCNIQLLNHEDQKEIRLQISKATKI